MPSTKAHCLVCENAEGKYKCPHCSLYTCSVPCFKKHRDNHPPIVSSTPAQSKGAPVTSTGGAGSHDGSSDPTQPPTAELSGIADMPEYKTLTQKYPRLEALLWNIAAATDPPANDNGSNSRHGSLSGSSKNRRPRNQPWTQDVGYENGVDVLRRTRETPGEDRNALREFSELFRLYKARKASISAVDSLRQQRAQDDAKAIGDLMRTEKLDDVS
ncbi:hypothetical protein GGS23DRAFT_595908 [Durotheca rogersii]|uniref:uncharacterized protein n=1 Tax=Durotheca rogersii TaxID=419775 RepID=UPI00221FDD09|nr:uncharacterized protein GGS23DRAFT_595908 [Durotheca rogersii]KAI5864274.1 hypothetical protein GGS23DRAFT_595908 [Durotheca rogersii]